MKTINLKITLIAGLLLIVAAGCSSLKISTDVDPEANFIQLQTFGWMPIPPPPPGPQGARAPLATNPFINGLVQKAITTELVARKFKLGVFGEPDFLVAFHVGARRKAEATEWGYDHYQDGVEIHEYTKGTLVIDVIDPRTRRLLWRGSALNVIPSRGKAGETIGKAVKKIMSKFPPN